MRNENVESIKNQSMLLCIYLSLITKQSKRRTLKLKKCTTDFLLFIVNKYGNWGNTIPMMWKAK